MSIEYKDEQIPGIASVESLIATLGHADDATRWKSRQSLVAMGQSAVPHLTCALKDTNARVRWEVAQALKAIADPSAIPDLVNALEDNNNDVRWTAVDALVAFKERTLIPLLRGLEQHAGSSLFRDSAHHVLKNLPLSQELRIIVTPVLDALSGAAPALEVPFVARTALAKLEEHQG